MTSERLHIVEPTLTGEAGHCLSFTESLCAAAGDHALTLWVGRGASLAPSAHQIQVERHFRRRFRRLQAFFLYRKLLAEPGRILVATAGRTDFLLLALAAGRHRIREGKVFLYVHWFRERPGKREMLARVARRHPELVVLGPTPTVVDAFRECGFRRAQIVPYPITRTGPGAADPVMPFHHLLSAGAARQDKGFRSVVDLVARLSSRGETVPVVIQVSSEQRDRHDEPTRRDLIRLQGIDYRALTVLPETLAAAEYAGLFKGGICLQPYDVREFADRVSGVTLDALSAGCPVVAVRGTWTARVVERFGAGVLVDDTSPETLHVAVRTVFERYPEYQERARRGGARLQEENSSRRLFEVLTG